MKQLFTYLLIILLAGLAQAQESKPCEVYEKLNFSTGPQPKIVPVFPGCESFDNNDLLNQCARSYIANKIADKMNMEFHDFNVDSLKTWYKSIIIMEVSAIGTLKLKTVNKSNSSFEILLNQKLEEIAIETGKISPAKTENNYCLGYKYRMPLRFVE